ncbi:MAG: methyltransferase domain-containing protein [bacterium]|nr:methyltransferase domain-containing protein [bacterium]
MDINMPDIKKEYWDNRAQQYGNSQNGFKAICSYGSPYFYNKYIDLIHKKVFYKMLNSIDIKNKKVLDLGCGVGRWCRILAQKGAKVTGADISNEMIKIAGIPADKNVDFLNAAIAEIELPADTFDLITCVTVLQHITDEKEFKKSVGNMVRLLNKNGKIFILEVAPNRARDKNSFSDILFIRSEMEYLSAFKEAGASLKNTYSVDIMPIKQKLILHSKGIPVPLYYLLLYISVFLSIPVDLLFSGTSFLKDHSWHKAFIFTRENKF